MQDLKAFLRSVALRCTLPFKANIAVSSILIAKKPEDSGNQVIQFFHWSEQNGALFKLPRIITKVEDIAWDIRPGQTPDALDVESETCSRVVMTSVAVFLHHLTQGGTTGKETNPDTQQKVSNLLQRHNHVIHIMCVYNGICMSIITNLSAMRHECVIYFKHEDLMVVSGEDNLCMFRCLAVFNGSIDLEAGVEQSRARWVKTNGPIGRGISVAHLDRFESMFGVGVAMHIMSATSKDMT